MKLFNNNKKIKVSSTKSSIGHLLGAAGSVESIFSILAMKNKIAPATLNLNKIDHIYDIDLVPKNPKDHNIDIVMSNSFGFGGTNTALLFKNI